MKEFPRIHSLGTINIIHHQEFFYEFDPFRTDFVWESGVGKSIITDLLQLILVGSTEYSSSTQAKDDRPFNSLVLQNSDSSDFGYAYINVEVNPQRYLVLGTYIEINNNQSQAFIIQKDLDFETEKVSLLDNYIKIDEFEKDGNWIPINDLDHYFNSDKGIGFKKFNRFRNYHNILLENDLLPIDVTSKSALKDYAKILQAFSRKGISFKDGVDLQEFLFGKQQHNNFFEQFKSIVSSMEDSMESYRLNRDELDRIEEKDILLDNLFKLKQNEEALSNNYNSLLFTKLSNEKEEIHSSIVSTIKKYYIGKSTSKKLKILRESKILSLDTELKVLEVRLKNKLEEVRIQKSKTQAIKAIESLMNNQGIKTVDELRKFHTKFQKSKKLYKNLIDGKKLFDKYDIIETFSKLNLDNKIQTIIREISKDIIEKKKELNLKNALYDFNDIENENSLASWVITNNKTLSPEQESIVSYFQGNQIGIVKPDNIKLGTQYIINPEKVIEANFIKENDGFWVDFGNVTTYITYVKEQIFNGKSAKAIIEKFKKERTLLKESISSISKFIKDKKTLLNFFDELETPQLFLDAWKLKDKLNYNDLDINKNILNKAVESLNIELEYYSQKEQILSDLSIKEEEQGKLIETKGFKSTLKSQLEKQSSLEIKKLNQSIIDCVEKYDIEETKEIELNFDEDNFYVDFVTKNNEAVGFLNDIEKIKQFDVKLSSINKQITELEFEVNDEIKKIEQSDFSEEKLTTVKKELDDAKINYSVAFEKLIDDVVENERDILKQTDDFKILVRYILPDIFHNIDFEEFEVRKKIREYLDDINRKNAEITKNKLVHIRDLMQDLQTEILRQTNIVRKIDNIFNRQDAEITGGHKVSLKKANNPKISTDWISKFLDELTVVNEGLFDPTNTYVSEIESRKKVSIEDHIKDEYERHSDYRLPNITLDKLLSPFSYYDLNYEIRTAGGKKNSGSTGQTFTAIALLCIAKLSLIQGEQGISDAGLRFMSIDEAAGIGSNFDMLKKIAKKYGYQILSLSIGLNRIDEGQQTIYKLFKNHEEDFINHHPVPIFSKSYEG